MEQNKIIVNAVTPEYQAAQNRLRQSLYGLSCGIAFSGLPTPKYAHKLNPYCFKLGAIESAHMAGYTQILWLDSSCYAVDHVNPIFDIIEEKGYFMEDAGHMAGTWTNDRTLQYFGITRDEAMTIPMYSAGFTGLDMQNPTARAFFYLWKKAMDAGMFKGAWDNKEWTESSDPRCEGHRHDMSCASIIAYKLGMTFERGGSYFQYAAPEHPLNHDKIIFKVQGI